MIKAALTPRLLAATMALFVPAAVVAGCGESEAEKAKAQVCKSRTEIDKQVESLKTLPISSSGLASAKTSFETILRELEKIRQETPKLEGSTKTQVESATSTFRTEIGSLASTTAKAAISGSSISAVGPQIKTALEKLATSYKQTIEQIPC
jgi:hypothetical protein